VPTKRALWCWPAVQGFFQAWAGVTVPDGMTTREKLHILVDELTDGEAEATLARLSRERELLRQWTASTDTAVTEDEWALANAREAIREERW
jgi:hypothetical protein